MAPGRSPKRKGTEAFPEDRLADLLAFLNQVIKAETEGKGIVAQITADARREHLLPHSLHRAELEYLILRLVGRSRRRFFPKGKTAERRTGYVQRKFNPLSVDLKGQTEAEVLARAIELGLYQYIRIPPTWPELDRAAIHADPYQAMAQLGIDLHRNEVLRVKVPAIRQSYVLKGRQILATIRGLRKEINPPEAH